MDQRSIVLFLDRKGLKATDIHNELVAVLDSDAVSYSTVTRYLREGRLALKESKEQEKKKNYMTDYTKENAILQFLEDEPYASIRTIAKSLRIPKSTVHYTLTQVLGWKIKHLRWIPHNLNSAQIENRVLKSKALLDMLTKAFHEKYDMVITLDESWFYLHNDYEQIWVNASAEPPTRAKKMISSKKIFITVVWRPSGILLIDKLPKGVKFNSQYMVSNILTPVCDMLKNEISGSERKLILHMDNAKPHRGKIVDAFIESSHLRKAPQPEYSPDVAPSDFFLFGYVKKQLEGKHYTSEDDLYDAIVEILMKIPSDVLKSSYRDWIKRLEDVIASNGLYQ